MINVATQNIKIVQPKLYIDETKHKGLGLFTNYSIEPNASILEFNGSLADYDQIPDDDMSLQIGPDKYLKIANDKCDRVNHSCDPNCFIEIFGSSAILRAFKQIKAKEELTFDYSVTCTECDWEMNCFCESKNCRKTISCFHTIAINKRLEYKQFIPDYVLNSRHE